MPPVTLTLIVASLGNTPKISKRGASVIDSSALSAAESNSAKTTLSLSWIVTTPVASAMVAKPPVMLDKLISKVSSPSIAISS